MLTMICLVVGTVLCFVIGGFCLNDYQHKWADLAAAVSMIIGIVGPKLVFSHEPIEIDGMFNVHGHIHNLTAPTDRDLNVCSMNVNYTPVNLNQLMKHGLISKVDSVHRITIDNAAARKKR